MSEWRVMKQYAGGEYYWRVYRIRDLEQTDHSGNREIIDTIFKSAEQAHKKADELNGYYREDKAAIAKNLGELLKQTRQYEDLKELAYWKRENGEEFVTALFENGARKTAYVTGDSGIAMIRDTIAYMEMSKWEEKNK